MDRERVSYVRKTRESPSDLSTVVRCEVFPISGFDFPELKGSGGDLKGSRSPIELAMNFHE